jgi:hypothetical protein
MKKLLVIADFPPNSYISTESHNLLNGAIGSQQLPKGVSQLAGNSWLIDAHTCLSFFVSLANTAQKYKVPIVAVAIDDEPIFLPAPQSIV